MRIGPGEIFSLASAVTWALAVVSLRKSGETLPAFELNLFKNVLGLCLMVPTALLANGLIMPAYNGQEWAIVLVSGGLGMALADYLYLKALNTMGASRTGITASLYSPFVILLSVLFLGERLGLWQMLGFVLVMAGILMVTWRQNRAEISVKALRLGVLFGVSAVFFMAIGIVMVKGVLERHPFFWTATWRLVAGVGGMLLVAAFNRDWRQIRVNFSKPQPWLLITVASFLGAYLAMILWLAGYKLTQASIASVLNETSSAFIVLFAFLILGESLAPRKLAGLALTLSGVLLVLFG